MIAYDFRWSIIWDHRGDLAGGLWVTLEVAALAFLLACVVGLPVALMRLAPGSA
jgi:ABC-type amino acid transport system permease subunit